MVAYANYSTDARIKNYVASLLKHGYEVDVFALGRHQPSQPGLRVYSLMSKVSGDSRLRYLLAQCRFLVLATIRVGAACARRRYELIHVHNMPDILVLSALLPRLLGAKVILDVHDTMPEVYATKLDVPLWHPLVRLLRLEERLSAALADHVITTNDLHREAIIGHGVPADKVSVIMNVGNEAIFRPRPRPGPRRGLTLVYHGIVAEHSGLDLVLEAIKMALPDCPGLKLVVIGDSIQGGTVRRLVAKNGLSDVVTAVGWLPVEELPQYLAHADAGVLGNRLRTEERQNWMLPVKMLECAAMEIPSVAPRLRVIARYFDDGNALLYQPDNVEDLARCIRTAYAHPERLAALRQGLRRFNNRYNWQTMEAHYLGLLQGRAC